MNKKRLADWIVQPKINAVLHAFSMPKTPRQVEIELNIKKLKLRPFLARSLLLCLNPEARKGRYYIITPKTKRLLKLAYEEQDDKDWDLIGWIKASPRQRLVILKAMDSVKRTSEEIRERASQYNPHLSRTSTKDILKELVNRDLVETEMFERKRYYWISEYGRIIKKWLDKIQLINNGCGKTKN